MRLQRALARAGVASRRAAETLIKDGKVRVDGRVATLGSSVDPDKQKITVGGRAVKLKARRWLAFHKPLGVVTTAKDEEKRRTVFDFIKNPEGLAYVGRLDFMTTGLLLLTTDGDAIFRLTHPRYKIPRHYTALVHGKPTSEVEQLVKKSWLVDGRPVITKTTRVRPGTGGRSIVDVTLAEGRNHVVRKWVDAMGLKIERLARISYGPIRLADLPPGESRPLTDDEERAIYKAVGLESESED
jgi:23S rRNA pseudouridine2605 synthase